MSCILRICGRELDVDKLTTKITIKPYNIYRKGEPRLQSRPEGKKNEDSGIKFLVSKADFDKLDRQINDAIKFLIKNKTSLKKISTNKDVDSTTLDFGINLRIGYDDIAFQFDTFPHQLLKLAGDLKIDLEVSLYPQD